MENFKNTINMKKPIVVLIIILLLNICLTVYGIWWGAPDRWNTDEHVAKALRFIGSKSIFTVVDTAHPQAYDIFLGIWMLPFLAFLKLIGYPLSSVQSAASISWIQLAFKHPGFASGAYIWGRLSSVLLNTISIVFIYKIALLIYKRSRAALMAALIAALSMGLIEIGHFTKATALVVMLLVGTAYYSFKALTLDFRKHIYIASIFAGAAFSVQADGGFALLYVAAATFVYLKREGLSLITVKTLFISGLLMISVFFMLWPAIIVNRDAYTVKAMAGFSMQNMPSFGLMCSKVIDNIKFTAYLFSPAIVLFVWGGIAYNLWKWRKHLLYNNIMAFVLVPYALMSVVYFGRFPGAYTKFLIHSVPILSLWAGFFIDDFLGWSIRGRKIRIACTILIFLVGALYAIKGSAVFAEYDTRYYSGKWIDDNMPRGSSIEHFQEVDVLFPARVLNTHNVIFYGKHSKDYAGKKFYDLIDSDTKTTYMERINKYGPDSDYIVVASGKDFLLPASLESEDRRNSIIYRLIENREDGYELTTTIEMKDSIFTHPKPGYTSPKIWIFKNTEKWRSNEKAR